MTSGLKSHYYTDTTDGDILDELAGQYGLDQRRGVRQAFARRGRPVRLDQLGLRRVPGRGERARRRRPRRGSPSARRRPTPPVVTAGWAGVLKLDAESDARWQVKGVTAKAWNATDQELVSADASEPSVTDSGNLWRRPLRRDRWRPAPAPARRQARRTRAPGMGRRTAPKKQARQGPRWGALAGSGGVAAGDVIEVTGIGKRFAGTQYVRPGYAARSPTATGRPTSPSDWPETFAATYPAQPPSPRASCCWPSTDCEWTVVRRCRTTPTANEIKVHLRLRERLRGGRLGPARRASTPATSGARSSAEIDDEVVVGFLDGDPRFPVVLGQCRAQRQAEPRAGQGRQWRSRATRAVRR